MSARIPPPQVQAFLVCQQIFEDRRTKKCILVAPFGGISLSQFPAAFRMSLYADLYGGHGSYALALELRDAELDVVWGWRWPKPIEHNDPLEPHHVILHDLVIPFAGPGRYDLVLLANGQDVARVGLQVSHAPR